MSVTTFLVIISVFLKIVPLTCHRLITNPHPEQEWDSIIVSSDPITIREKTHNKTMPLKSNEILRPQKRSYEECPENDFTCLYGNQENKSSNPIVNKFLEQYSLIADDKLTMSSTDDRSLRDEIEKENSRKSYWSMVDSQTHNHPYDDNKGWVTLDPVPWSTSKISKWHPNKVGIQEENKPWRYGSTTQRPVQQFWVSGSSYNPQRPDSHWGIGTNDIITDNKPSDFPVGQYHANQDSNYQPHNGVYGNAGNYNQFHQNQMLKGLDDCDRLIGSGKFVAGETFNPAFLKLNFNFGFAGTKKFIIAFQKSREFEFCANEIERGNENPEKKTFVCYTYIQKYSQSTHPSTYPSNGNGEWVLLSTTKGSSHPQRHRWTEEKDLRLIDRVSSMRKIKPVEISKYHEEDLNEKFILGDENSSGNRKSDSNGAGGSEKHDSTEKTPIQILYTGAPKDEKSVTTVRRKVRLQVLPSLESSSTSYGGLLEVDSNSQTVDEAQQEDEKMKKLKAIANVKKNKFRGFKLVPTSKVTGKGMNQKNIMTLAAVGAGMIPATMALLVPMALGRRKRSVSLASPELERTPTFEEIQEFQKTV